MLDRSLLLWAEREVLELGLSYFKITIIGTFFWVYSLSYNMIIRGEGKMEMSAIIMAGGLIVNVIANYISMVILHFGVEGAAWGTNLGMIVYTIISTAYFKSGKTTFEANVFSFRRDKKIIARIISIGMPSLIMSIMSLIQGLVVLNAIGSVGNDYDLAFYGVSYRIMLFMMTPLFALMRSLQPTVGMNYGAKNCKRVINATKVYIKGSLILLVPVYLLAVTFPRELLGLMFSSQISNEYLLNFKIFISVIPLLTLTMSGLAFFPSIGDGKTAGVVAILRQAILYIPAMIFLPRLFGVKFVYIGSFLIDALIAIVLGILMLKAFAKLRKLSNEKEK